MTALPEIASLWIGSALSYIERVVLQSYMDRGHAVTLYTLEPVANVPDGVTIRTAQDLAPPAFAMDPERIRFTAGVYSDLFRLEMIARTNAIWVDLDAYCAAPFDFESPYVFGSTKPRRSTPNNGVLRLPHNSEALAILREFLNSANPIPWWWRPRRTAPLIALRDAGTRHGIENFAWSFSGPMILRITLQRTGEISHILPKPVFYPIIHTQVDHLLDPAIAVESLEGPSTKSVHLFGATKLNLIANHNGLPPDGCYIDHICKRHNIDPHAYPLDMSRGGRDLVSDVEFDGAILES